MKVFESVFPMQDFLKKERFSGKSIGLVPTMGALHEGHLSLIRTSSLENEATIASIFVNPLQFNNTKDLDLYPRTLEKDLEMLKGSGCSAVFAPSVSEMYPSKPSMKVTFGSLEEVMEGKFRPGHFNGVGIVVSKLFHLVSPDKAYFGQKDLQQFAIIARLVKDLSFSLDLVCCPIYREPDGLAMSSRNVRLTPQNRPVAANIYKSLQLAAKSLFELGPVKTKEVVIDFISGYKELELEYFEIADRETLEPIIDVKEHQEFALCIAVYLDGVRLIDNVLVKRP
jgi:pantoate--beta-alanine ligase